MPGSDGASQTKIHHHVALIAVFAKWLVLIAYSFSDDQLDTMFPNPVQYTHLSKKGF